ATGELLEAGQEGGGEPAARLVAEAPAAGSVGAQRRVGVTRLHLEEDAGKSFHATTDDGGTTVDFNRCGVPLIEIVSEPDLRTPAEAYLYLTRLKQVLRYVGVSDVNMEEGSLRCDANVSVRPAGSGELGTKTEVKNLNSFRNVERALDFEIARQVETVAAGGRVEHQTLLWDAARGSARAMRSKELSHDYRYFPEPDLGPLLIDALEVETWRASLPEMPAARRERLTAQYGIPRYDAEVLSATRELADWFEAAATGYGGSAKEVSNWVMGEVLRVLNERQIDADALPVRPEGLAELLALKDGGEVSGRTAKAIFETMLETGKGPREILEAENLAQISEDSELRALASGVLEERPREVEGYLGGRQQLLSFFIGEIMKKTRGRANPQAAGQLLRDLLEERRSASAAGVDTSRGEEGVATALAEIPGTPESGSLEPNVSAEVDRTETGPGRPENGEAPAPEGERP
ncbi:MAG: Asp-tRNA(Asn)/Glu-tRNA(Gln) amidotransferase subunit GatB, partial [Chloroflexi bacterium]|nr:Asp-tRNA(Asn)/Glu-tRNA(Gln) amidotransferase subunit GatB [Chloroflexota bacterium]